MAKKKTEWWDQPVPVVFPLTHLRVIEERGADPINILKEADIDPDFIRHPTELRISQMNRLFDAMLNNVGDNGLGIDIGCRLPPTAFGNFGYALLCSETLRDTLRLCEKYWHLVARGMKLFVQQQADIYIAEVDSIAPLPERMHRLVLEITFSSLYRGLELLAGNVTNDVEIWFGFSPPPHVERVRTFFKNVSFDMPSNQIRFPADVLNIRLSMHNPTALKFALEQCEREQTMLDTEANKILVNVRNRIVLSDNGYPNLELISDQLNMATRTLRRRLEHEGTTFKALVEEAKRRDAVRLLDDHELPVQKIAELLGYNDPANFTRAFKQWTDQTPSQYRQTRRSSE